MPERIPQSATIRVPLLAYSSSDHVTAATGKTISVTISKNGGAFANPSAGATNATEIASGAYYVDLSTTDTGTLGPLFVLGTATGTDNVIVPYNVVKATNGGLTALPDTAVSTNASLLTSGTGTDQVSVSAGKVLLQATQTGVTIPTVTTVTNQLTAAAIATGVWQDATAGDFTTVSSIGKLLYNIQADGSGYVKVSSGTGTGQISLSSGTVTVGTNNDKTNYTLSASTGWGGSALPTSASAASIASAVWQDTTAGDFTVAGSIGKSLAPATLGTSPGALGGLFIAGTNAATTVNFTGNLSGSVGSVTGNVGGNLVGNVQGSVGSVASGVTVSTNNDKTGYTLTVTPPTAAQVATAVWTDATSGDFATAGTPGKILVSQLGNAFTTSTSSVFTTGALANAPTGGGGASDPLANPVPGTYAVGTAGYALGHGVPGASNLLDNVVTETGVNGRQALALILDGVYAKLSGATTSTITVYDAPTGTVARGVIAVDGNGNRTGNPVLNPPA